MSSPATSRHAAAPTLEIRAQRQWDGFSARRVHASAGLHETAAFDDHRVVFYPAGPVPTQCACDGRRQQRLQTPGDFDVVPAGAAGAWEDAAPVSMVSARISPALVGEVVEQLGAGAARVHVATRLGERDPLVRNVLMNLAAELDAPEPTSRLFADSLAWALASRILEGAPMRSWRAPLTFSNAQLGRVLDYIEAHLDQDISLADLSAVAGVSIPHLATLFRRTLGQPPHRYLVERRVLRARNLLLSGRTAIAEVAEQTGFADQSHMARWMKRRLGVTPVEVLRQR
jgi:AraC family transcriptional regulator